MPKDNKAQPSDKGQQGSRELYFMLILVVLSMAAIITSLFYSANTAQRPDASLIVLRINFNIISAHNWTQDFFQGNESHNIQDILFKFDQAADFVRASLEGDEISGVPIGAIKAPHLRSQMEDIGFAIEQLKKVNTDLLAQEKGSVEFEKINIVFEDDLLKFEKLTNDLATSTMSEYQDQRKRLQIFQIILLVLALGLFLVIVLNSRKAQTEKQLALSLVSEIEERRKLALEGANLGTWDWNVLTGELVFDARWAEMLGLENDEVQPNFESWEKLVHPDDLPRVLGELDASLAGKSSRLFSEYRMWAQPGHWIWILDLGKVLKRDADGNPLRAVGTHLDITQLKTVELELRSEKERAQMYLDLAGVIFVALDSEGVVTMINRKGCQVLGLPEENIVGRNWVENFVPQGIRQEIQGVSKKLMAEQSPEHVVNPILTAAGAEVLIAWYNTTLHDEQGQVIGHLSSGTDVTQQFKQERSLETHRKRLQSLATQLAITEDHLRQDISSGLHDSIGQNLAALKLSIDIIGINLDKPENLDINTVREDIAKVSKRIDGIVREIWSLSFQLSPPGLYELGIGSALEWLVGQYNEKHECHFVLKTHEHPLPLVKDGRGLLFQMIRELMANAVKHGRASEVEISLSGAGDNILATVVDNGLGFDKKAAFAETGDAGGFGLFSIRERLAYISGKLEIDSVVGEGTRVEIRFPLGNAESCEMGTDDEDQNFAG